MTREEAIKYGVEWLKDEYLDAKDEAFIKIALEALEQEPKTGHWIDDKCSVCGKGIEDLIDSREWYRNEQPKG